MSTTTKHEIAKPEKATPKTDDQETAMAMHKAGISKGRRPMVNPDKMTPGNKRVAPKGRY